jgi:ATP-dependent DNA ligase
MIADGTYWVFDLPNLPGKIKPVDHQEDRRLVLEHLVPLLHDSNNHIHLVAEAKTTDEKKELFTNTLLRGSEGIVVKHRYAAYDIGRRTNAVIKIKHVKTVDCVVMATNTGGVENAELGMYENGMLRQVGACSMIGKPDVIIGEVVEVKCLYATDGNWLYQPRFMRPRPDKTAADCDFSQVLEIVTNREAVA